LSLQRQAHVPVGRVQVFMVAVQALHATMLAG
jgi:hypothetical protein